MKNKKLVIAVIAFVAVIAVLAGVLRDDTRQMI